MFVCPVLALVISPIVCDGGFIKSDTFTKSNRKIRTQRIQTPNVLHNIRKPYCCALRSSSPLDNHVETSLSEQNATSAWSALALYTVNCLFQSDLKRMGGNDGASTGWTSWVDHESEIELRNKIDDLSLRILKNDGDENETSYEDLLLSKWIRLTPDSMLVELSDQIRIAADRHIEDDDLKTVESTRTEMLNRIGCRLVLLPSGAELKTALWTPTGGMAYGKLLYGGVKRYRLLRNQRRAGERTVIFSDENGSNSWLQHGGPERKYQAVDMGPAAILELVLLPKGLTFSKSLNHHSEDDNLLQKQSHEGSKTDMELYWLPWQPDLMFHFCPRPQQQNQTILTETNEPKKEKCSNTFFQLLEKERSDAFKAFLTSKVGGLQPQIEAIVRRVMDGRMLHEQDLEASELALLGLQPVKGMLLYGKSGCGKTALAREIARVLQARPPKIVSAPELLDKWVGGSERLVRDLFSSAEADLAELRHDDHNNSVFLPSSLHIIVIDEIDAVFRKRTASDSASEATRSSVVNQILAKMDGVKAIPNVLLIGMTNRRELLDEALLRPGRLEVQIEIPLPTEQGRREILQIHFRSLRQRGRLSVPLCRAIDGEDSRRSIGEMHESYLLNDDSINVGRRYDQKIVALKLSKIPSFIPKSLMRLSRLLSSLFFMNESFDLAADKNTIGFSGADIAGLVRCAGSIALSRARMDGSGVNGLFITVDDVKKALIEMKSK